MLVRKDGSSEGLMPDNHNKAFDDVTGSLPNMLPAPAPAPQARPGAGRGVADLRPQARPQPKSTSSGSFLKMLSTAAKVANVATKVMNGGGGGGDSGGWGGDSGGVVYDTSGFSAGLQQDTWSSVGGAASDPIQ